MPDVRTLADLLPDFLAAEKSANHSPHTLRAYRVNVSRCNRWLEQTYGARAADRLQRKHLDDWLQHLGERRARHGLPLRPSSVNKNIENLRQWIGWLSKQGLVMKSLLEPLVYIKEPQLLPTSVLTHAQVKKLIAVIPSQNPVGYRDRTMVELLYSTGVRITELLTLEIPNVDLANATAIVMGKGQKQRMVPIGRTALRCMQTYLVAIRPFLGPHPGGQRVFIGRGGKPVHYMTFLRAVHGYARAAGLEINVTPHTFRRSCTTELVRGGANLYHVKELLGHENLNTLRHYARLTINDLKKTHERCHPREREESPTG